MTTSTGIAERARRAFLALVLLGLTGCGYYSFTGASIPAELNTVAIPLAEMSAATPLPSLPDELTRLLTDRFVRQTRLTLEPDESVADVVLTSRITGYRSEPAAIGGDLAERTRVTITVSVRYAGRARDEAYLDRTFSAFSEYAPSDGFDGETQAAQQALEQIAEDVFTAATSNW